MAKPQKIIFSESGHNCVFSLLLTALLLATAFCLAFTPSGNIDADDSGEYGNTTWSLSGTELTISKKDGTDGKMKDGDGVGPWGEDVTEVTINDGVTTIGSSAFEDCWDLISVAIPDTVTSIGAEAFVGCSDLTYVTIPRSVTFIGTDAFRDCDALTYVAISALDIGRTSGQFGNCSALQTVIFYAQIDANGLDRLFPDCIFRGLTDGHTEAGDVYGYTSMEDGMRIMELGEYGHASYLITFHPENGLDDIVMMVGGTLGYITSFIADPVKPGYMFDGWFIGPTKLTLDYVFTSDADVYAHWTPIPAEDDRDRSEQSQKEQTEVVAAIAVAAIALATICIIAVLRRNKQ